MKTRPVILGTAGHIDHGKTSLVRALTGIDTDRLKEEKARGITIELGFAHLDVDGQRFGVVDVPGHERFIRTMVAGASGVDVVILVIAADEGVMPQTREHLDVCALLGIERGVVALSKVDLVEPDVAELVTDDVRGFLKGTFLHDARIVPLSVQTGAGIAELRWELVRLAGQVQTRGTDDLFRLPLDRVFTMKGFGTVTTGTVLGGVVNVGDDLQALPSGRTAKVRGIQAHGEAVASASAGMRAALNLSGVERAELARGDMLARPESLAPAHLVDAKLRYLSTSRAPLVRRAQVLVYHGTQQTLATMVVLDGERVEPGGEAFVQLRVEVPLAALPGDRFVVRGFVLQEHYGTTLGGGTIVRVHGPKHRRASRGAARTLEMWANAAAVERVALEIKAAGPAGLSRAAVLARLGLGQGALTVALDALVKARELVSVEDTYLHAEVVAALEAGAVASVRAFHHSEPHKEGLSRQELRSKLSRALPARFFDLLLSELARKGTLVSEREVVRDPKHKLAETSRPAAPLTDAIVRRFAAWGLAPPRPQEVPAALGEPARDVLAILDVLVREKRLVRVKADYFVDAGHVANLREQLRAHLDAHGQITPQQWKQLTGVSRKFAIPLAEHFDAEKLTLRVGDVRKRRG